MGKELYPKGVPVLRSGKRLALNLHLSGWKQRPKQFKVADNPPCLHTLRFGLHSRIWSYSLFHHAIPSLRTWKIRCTKGGQGLVVEDAM